jgi:hypothetical protein
VTVDPSGATFSELSHPATSRRPMIAMAENATRGNRFDMGTSPFLW